MCALPLEKEIEYPTSDGQPMAETTLHRKVMSNLIGGLERRYADVADAARRVAEARARALTEELALLRRDLKR